MAQPNPNQYVKLIDTPIYGQGDGLYYDKTNTQLVWFIGDNIVCALDSNGAMTVNDALNAASLGALVASQAQGDIIVASSATAFARLAAGTSGQLLIGNGTTLVSVAMSGDITITSGGVTAIGASKVTNAMLAGSITRAKLLQEAAAVYAVPLETFRVHDAPNSFLPAAASADDMGLVPGTFGTSSPMLQGVDFGGTATDEMARFFFKLPPEYDAGETITLRAHAGILTTVADAALTLDCEAYANDGEGAVGSDLCQTAAQDINNLTLADKDFTIDPTGLAAGDELDIRLTFAGSDTGNLGIMIPAITKVSMLLDIKG